MSLVLFEQFGPVGKVTLNNPDQLNAMTPEMGNALSAMVDQVNQNLDLRVVVITGAGRAFSAGGDLQFILDHTKKSFEENKQEMVEFYAKFLKLRDITVPTIAALNGHAIGAGLLIALACDLRIAATEAKLAANFAKLGLSSGMGGLYWLTRLAGPALAAELLFTGKAISADEALHLRLVNAVYPAAEVLNKAMGMAEQIALNSPIALKILKKGVQRAVTASLKDIIDYEAKGQATTFLTEDLKEGIKAIQEKREPRFVGK